MNGAKNQVICLLIREEKIEKTKAQKEVNLELFIVE